MTKPPPERPEMPEGAERQPVWPAWFAWVGFLVGITGVLVLVGTIAAIVGADGESPAFVVIATLAQGAVFIGTAVWFASRVARPKAWHFGLRSTRFWPALGWAALGVFSFYMVAAIYGALVKVEADQDVVESLGGDEGTFGLIVAGLMVIAVAPVAEEIFFRGFFYRALRSRFPIVAGPDGRAALRRHPLQLRGCGRPPDPAAAGAARLHLLSRLREDRLAVPRDRDARVQQRARLRRPGGRRLAGVGGGRAARPGRLRPRAPAAPARSPTGPIRPLEWAVACGGLATTFSVFALLAFAPGAFAQIPPLNPAPAPAPPVVKPKPGKIKIHVKGGQATRKLRYVARGGAVRVSGRVKPFVAGQTAVLEVFRRGKVVSRQTSRIRRRGGKVSFRFRTKRRGVLRLRVRHSPPPPAGGVPVAARCADQGGGPAGRARARAARRWCCCSAGSGRSRLRPGQRLLRRRDLARAVLAFRKTTTCRATASRRRGSTRSCCGPRRVQAALPEGWQAR